MYKEYIYPYIQLIRPHNWIKNLFVFGPLFFSLQMANSNLFVRVLYTAIVFSLAASSIYIINDWFDRKEDQIHPIKKDRPLASGKISSTYAFVLCIFLLTISLFFSRKIQPELFYIILSYLIINILYSLWLKHIALIDIFIITFGFILRIVAGAVVINNEPSMWIMLMTFLLALFLSLAKRRDDVLLVADGKQSRRNIKGYSLEFLNTGLAIMASVIVVSYIFYCISPEVEARFNNHNLYYTVVFVILGILRFLQIIIVEKKYSEPTHILLSDRFLQIVLIGWILFFMSMVYF